MPNSGNLTPRKPGQSGNINGKPKGAKNLSTVINELLNDSFFAANIRQGYTIKALVHAQILLAINGDQKAFELLAKIWLWHKNRPCC